MFFNIVNLFKDFVSIIKADALIIIPLIFLCADYFGTWPYYWGLVLVPVMVMKSSRTIRTDKNLSLIILFSCTYSIIAFLNGYFNEALGNTIFYSVYPAVFYMVGVYLGRKYRKNIIEILILFPIILSIYPVFMGIQDILTNQFVNVTRELFDKNGNYVGSATLLGTKVSLIISFCASLMFPIKNTKERILQLIMFVFFVLGITLTLHLVSRTGLFLAAICLLTSIIFNYKYLTKSQYLLITLGGASFIYLYGDLLLTNLSISEEAYIYRSDHGSTIAGGGGRVDIWIKSIGIVLTEPFGIPEIQRTMFNYAHNLWLDFSITAGLIPLILFLRITYRYIKSFIRFYKLETNIILKSLILTYNIALLLQCSVEPVADGCMPFYFYIFLLFGITHYYEKNDSMYILCQ